MKADRGTAWASTMAVAGTAVCCGLHLGVLPLLVSGALAGLVGAFAEPILTVLTALLLLGISGALLIRHWRAGSSASDATAAHCGKSAPDRRVGHDCVSRQASAEDLRAPGSAWTAKVPIAASTDK